MLARTGEGLATEAALYSAFISYSHHDRAAATRLQRRIEGYRLPRHLRRKGASARLKPVFRDRDELSAAPDLSDAVTAALRRSEHLIVVCTPAAAASAWVGREIDYFRANSGGSVLTALLAGESGQAMHAALRHDAAGAAAHPLAADFRPGGDGRRLALLKLIAPLAGVRLDELVQRDAQRRIRQIATLAAAAVVLVIAATALVLATMQARAAAEREQARSADAMRFQLTDLRRKLEAEGRLDLLAEVNRGVERYCAGLDKDAASVAALIQCAAGLQANGQDDEKRGDLAAARTGIIKAWRLTAPLLAAYPDDPKVIYAHAQSEYYMGFINSRRSDIANARRRFELYAGLANKLATLDPGNAEWLRERAFAASNLGIVALRQARNPTEARAFFTAAQIDFMAVARDRPDTPDIQADIADGEAWLADTFRVAGDLGAAATHRQRQRTIISAQVERSPQDATLRLRLVISEVGLARVEAAQGNFPQAIERLAAAHSNAVDLARADPENRMVAMQVRAIEIFTVQTWLSMPTEQRPPLASAMATLGDCAVGARNPLNDELAALCRLQAARLAAISGRQRQSAILLDSVCRRQMGLPRQFTERWRLDLTAACIAEGYRPSTFSIKGDRSS